ncbi:MAG: V-type ATP synthase subunit D [Bacteroidales bacterium]|nr:V-type ATP synthase subunit D [Bacteroidales bacterium]
MKIQLKYNKTALREFQKKLQIRERALPTLKNKESVLRAMVLEARKEIEHINGLLLSKTKKNESWKNLWQEFNTNLIQITKVHSTKIKVAGIDIPVFENLDTMEQDFSLFNNPYWFRNGVQELKDVLEIRVRKEYFSNKILLLEQARKKATQKVNLYEKVQIPTLASATRQIKRYLEDEENLAKAGQKLLKQKLKKGIQS